MPRRWHRPSWFAVALTLVGVALFLRLGFWQLARMGEKRAMLVAGATALNERKPVPLADAAWDAARARAYDWVEGSGAFADHLDPVLLDNQVRNGRAGVEVYRVFDMEQGKDDWRGRGAILVDLGWLPLGAQRELPPLKFPQSSRMQVRGLLAPPPSAGLALGPAIAHEHDAWLATRMDLPAIAPKALAWSKQFTPALAPRVLRLDPALPMGFERDLEVLPSNLPPERHRAYAVTWFCFSFVALVIFLALHWRKDSPKSSP